MANLNQPFNGINSIFPYAENRGTSDSVTFPASVLRANQTGTLLVVVGTDKTSIVNTVTWIVGAVGDWFNCGNATMVLQTGSSVTATAAVVAHRNSRLGGD
jgi:hypothetical protein